MKKRLHDKAAGVVSLTALLIISLAETIIRAVQPDYAFSVTDLGEPFAIAIFAAITLLFTLAKKDRACYLCCGIFIAWFMLEEALSIPGTIKTLSSAIANIEQLAGIADGTPAAMIASVIVHLLTSISIVVIGALVAEYMNDGTIYNRAFNLFCVITVLLLLAAATFNVVAYVAVGTTEVLLLILNNLHRLTMVFLFTFFAYDSAKAQLKKTSFTE